MTIPTRTNHATITALIARGVGSELARQLAGAGHTLAALKQADKPTLARLGLDDDVIDAIHSGPRPPIPPQVLDQELYTSRRMCCICRDPLRPIVVHHIVPWHQSHSHDPDNLVVLCGPHHDEAHTRRELTMSLTADHIRRAKARWLQYVREMDAAVITQRTAFSTVLWDYFNHSRICDIVHSDKDLRAAYKNKLDPLPGAEDEAWMYAGDIAVSWARRTLFGNATVDIMRTHGFISLNALSPGEAESMIAVGNLVLLQSRYRFKGSNGGFASGPGQMRRARARFAGVTFEFTIDAWEATSASAWHSHLLDENMELAALFYIRSISGALGALRTASATCLAIGSGITGIHWSPGRTAPLPPVGIPADPEPVHCSDRPSICQRCGSAFGVAMYDAQVDHGGGYICQKCFEDTCPSWFVKYERTLAPGFEWVIVARGPA